MIPDKMKYQYLSLASLTYPKQTLESIGKIITAVQGPSAVLRRLAVKH